MTDQQSLPKSRPRSRRAKTSVVGAKSIGRRAHSAESLAKRTTRRTVIERSSLAEEVRGEILGRILRGDLRPGERIIEMRIAQELGTSQAPVREALRALDVLGVIESSRNRGARVRMLGARELVEITNVRAELEGYAAGLAARRLMGQTGALESQIKAMQQAAKIRDMQRFAEANTAFHRAIVEASGNGTLLDIWTQLGVKAHTVMNVLRGHSDLASVADSHWPIVDAVRARDPRAARRAIRKHILDLKLDAS